jgi:hypothetical protein
VSELVYLVSQLLLRIIYDSTSQIRFFINNALAATHTTNIPGTSTPGGARVHLRKTVGSTDRSLLVTGMAVGRFA